MGETAAYILIVGNSYCAFVGYLQQKRFGEIMAVVPAINTYAKFSGESAATTAVLRSLIASISKRDPEIARELSDYLSKVRALATNARLKPLTEIEKNFYDAYEQKLDSIVSNSGISLT